MTAPPLEARGFRLHRRHVFSFALVALLAWITIDVFTPRRADFTHFDATATARLDGEMWRSYYERKPVRLFWQLSRALRAQFHAGVWRSIPIAYRAAKAAFIFKDGRTRVDYMRALPDLERYFASISALSVRPFDARAAARNELEWWIIRRERALHSTDDWKRLIALVAGEIYHLPPERFAEYASLRVDAMVLRDARGGQVTEEDWSQIGATLVRSYAALAAAVASS